MSRLVIIFIVLAGTTTHAQVQTNPSLNETLQWMQDTFPDTQTVIAYKAGEKRDLTVSGCTVTIHEDWTAKDGVMLRRENIIDLSLIDPQSVRAYQDDILPGKFGTIMLTATNGKKVISETTQNRAERTPVGKPWLTQDLFIDFIGLDRAERFAQAFRHAVILCGGKSSTF